jgi:16S rRNA G1207 methylase RsmC
VSGLLGSIQATVEALSLDETRHLLDLGGGHGFYSIALAQKYPHMHITLLDLPQVIPLAQMYVRNFAQEARIRCVGANFLQEDIGDGFDAVLCANVLHSDKRDIVLPKVFCGLNRGGQIIVKCRIENGEPTVRAALAKLLWHIRGGKEFYSSRQWEHMIANHGFEQLRTVNVEGIFATIIGTKP